MEDKTKDPNMDPQDQNQDPMDQMNEGQKKDERVEENSTAEQNQTEGVTSAEGGDTTENTTDQGNEFAQNEQVEENPVSEEKNADSKDVEDNKLIAALSYIGILFLVPLLAKKDSPFAQFHAKQGLVIFIVEVISPFLMPFLGLGAILWLLAVIFSIWGLVNVFTGKMVKMPVVGDIAEKFNL